MSEIKRTTIILRISLSFHPAAATSALSAEVPGMLTPIRIGIASRGTLDMPYFVALERGFFREEGLAPEII